MDFNEDWRDGRYDNLHGDEDEIDSEIEPNDCDFTQAEYWEQFIKLECNDFEDAEGVTRYTFEDGSIMRIKK